MMKYTIVKELIVYPIKGGQGIQLDQVDVQKEGLQHDRRWMLVEEDGTFISQRNFPELTQLKVRLNERSLQAEINGDSIEIPFDAPIASLETVHVWKSTFTAGHLSEKYDQFFSDHLGKSLRLINLNDKKSRVKEFPTAPFKTTVSFADGYPILLLGQKSLDHLSELMEKRIDPAVFRPNLIVESKEPHEEDGWTSLYSNLVEIQSVKPCARCQVINIDPVTGISTPTVTKKLVAYRRDGNVLNFGMNMIVNQEGKICVGDRLEINHR